ncbi:MAG TPA: PA14 domain-containing protein, partial [Pirellulales bacterium]|nr:PA14 domain-containing protein [Pirellulales bacterium]
MGAGLRDALIHCVDGGEYPVRDRTLNEHKRTGDLLPPLTHLGVSAASDLMIARSDALGEDYRGNLFSAQFNLHKILRHKLERSGATFKCRNEDFVVSSDADFHPTDVLDDADGSLLVVDTGGWFRIGCPTSQLSKPDVLGGIYRVRARGNRRLADPRGGAIVWDSLSAEALAKLLADARIAVRDCAMARLARLGIPAVSAAANVRGTSDNTEARCAAVWTLSRIDAEPAAAAVRAALDDPQESVRQAAARAAGLARDAAAGPRLQVIVTSDAPHVRREAATALGRIGQSSAVPALLEALNAPAADRFLEHAIIFALIRIDDQGATRQGLQMASSQSKRGALVALDQMDRGGLTPDVVTPFLAPADPLLEQTAMWVIAHHGEWGAAMVEFFRQWLSARVVDDARREELRRQLVAFAKDAAVQDLMGHALGDSRTPADIRLLVLEAIAQAPVAKVPGSWKEPLRSALADADPRLVRQAVATLRSLPLDKRPLLSRIDAQVNFPLVDKRFAGTRLSENFCARWTGVVRCPRDAIYTFSTESDDGSELFIDGSRVVDNSGSHALREIQGEIQLQGGDHDLRLDFVQGEGEAGCKLRWSFEGRAKQIVPAGALFHRARGHDAVGAAALQPGLAAEFFELGGRTESFPDLLASDFDQVLLRVATNPAQTLDVRVQAAAAVAGRLPALDASFFDFLIASMRPENAPLVRLDAADALGEAHLEAAQLKALATAMKSGGVLEMPKLLRAFEQSSDIDVGRALVAALPDSEGWKSLTAATLTAALATYPDEIRHAARPLVEKLSANKRKQQSRLDELADVATSGDIQRGRELFFGNKQAICASCHAVQGQGGQIGPELSKIGAIRAPRDLVEAIVFPSASFARGYEPLNVVVDDGRVLSGIVARETADAI